MLTEAAIFSVFALCGQWWMYFGLWVLPLATLAKTLTFLRNVAEHVAQDRDKNPEHARLRTLRCGRIEAFFFAPLNFNYHAEHHIYPGIPYYNLPEAHRLLSRKPAYVQTVDVQDGYLHTILVRAPQVARVD